MSPSFVLAFSLASLYGLGFYLFFGHQWLWLLIYWIVSVIGFFLGQWGASLIGLSIFNIGEVNLIEGTLASWLSMLAVRAWRNR